MKIGNFEKTCQFEHRKWQENRKITELEETEESDAHKLIKIITELTHITDRRNHITIAIKTDGSEKKFKVDTGSLVTIIRPEKEVVKDKKTLPITRKYQDVN